MTDQELLKDLSAAVEYYYPQKQKKKQEIYEGNSWLASFLIATVLLPLGAIIYVLIFTFEVAKSIIQGVNNAN